jgi:hypothetical protein
VRYLQLAQDNALELIPARRPASATLAFVGPSGSSISSPSVTLDNTNRTIASVGDFSFTVAAGAGTLAAGRVYWVVSPTEPAFTVRLSDVNGSTCSYEDKPAGTITTSCTLVGARLTATVLAANVGQTGQNYQLRWTVTGADGVVTTHHEMAAITRVVFNPPVTAAVVARHAGYAMPHVAATRPADYWDDIARRACKRVEQRIIASGKLPALIGDQSLLEDAGFAAMQIELARDGLVPQGFDLPSFLTQMEDEMRSQMEYALSNVWHDDNQDGAVEDAELRGPKSIRLMRV